MEWSLGEWECAENETERSNKTCPTAWRGGLAMPGRYGCEWERSPFDTMRAGEVPLEQPYP